IDGLFHEPVKLAIGARRDFYAAAIGGHLEAAIGRDLLIDVVAELVSGAEEVAEFIVRDVHLIAHLAPNHVARAAIDAGGGRAEEEQEDEQDDAARPNPRRRITFTPRLYVLKQLHRAPED